MNDLIHCYKKLHNATKVLGRSVELFKLKLPCEKDESLRDSIILLFEYMYEALWKFLKKLLFCKYSVFVIYPKSIFQESYNMKIITNHELKILQNSIFLRKKYAESHKKEVIEVIVIGILNNFSFIDSMIDLFEKHIK
jgi:hypothetical protein